VGSFVVCRPLNEEKQATTLVDVRESNLSDAGSIPAISTGNPFNETIERIFILKRVKGLISSVNLFEMTEFCGGAGGG